MTGDSLSPTLRPAVYLGVEAESDVRFKVIHSPGSEIVLRYSVDCCAYTYISHEFSDDNTYPPVLFKHILEYCIALIKFPSSLVDGRILFDGNISFFFGNNSVGTLESEDFANSD